MTNPGAPELSVVLIQLFKGPLYRDSHEALWEALLKLRGGIGEYVDVLNLQVDIDEAEGYAFLRSRPVGDDDTEVPRLIARRPLSFHLSVLLALLRKRLAEFDRDSSDARLVLSREQVIEMLRLFLPESTNEARIVDTIDTHITKAVELGFLRRLREETDHFEVRRILRAFVDAQWLNEFDQRLDHYRAELAGTTGAR